MSNVVTLVKDAMRLDADTATMSQFKAHRQPCYRFICYGITCMWFGPVMPVLVFANGCGEVPVPLWMPEGFSVQGALPVEHDAEMPFIEASLSEVILRTSEFVKLTYTDA